MMIQFSSVYGEDLSASFYSGENYGDGWVGWSESRAFNGRWSPGVSQGVLFVSSGRFGKESMHPLAFHLAHPGLFGLVSV